MEINKNDFQAIFFHQEQSVIITYKGKHLFTLEREQIEPKGILEIQNDNNKILDVVIDWYEYIIKQFLSGVDHDEIDWSI